MTISNIKSFINSIRYASRGLSYVFRHERNFRIQFFIALLVIGLMIVVQVDRKDMLLLLLIIAAVMILELINTVVEAFVNVVEPKIQSYAQIMKDIMAAAVLLASLFAAVLGILIFWPYFANIFG